MSRHDVLVERPSLVQDSHAAYKLYARLVKPEDMRTAIDIVAGTVPSIGGVSRHHGPRQILLLLTCQKSLNLLQSRVMITKEEKAKAIALTQVTKDDVGSPQAQVSILTARIKEVTEHLKANKHDHMARRGLIQMVGRRKKLLKYLENTDFEAYKAVVAKLGLRK